MNAHIVDVFDEIVFALFKPRNLFSNAIVEPAIDVHSPQQSPCMGLAFFSVWTKRFNFRMLNIAAQDIAKRDEIRVCEFVQAIAFSVVRVDAL